MTSRHQKGNQEDEKFEDEAVYITIKGQEESKMIQNDRLFWLLEHQDQRHWISNSIQEERLQKKLYEIAVSLIENSQFGLHIIDLGDRLQRGCIYAILHQVYAPIDRKLLVPSVYGETWSMRMNTWIDVQYNVWENLHKFLVKNGFTVANTERFITKEKERLANGHSESDSDHSER
jgi:hypothetical protein